MKAIINTPFVILTLGYLFNSYTLTAIGAVSILIAIGVAMYKSYKSN